jgi:hypothetical protein
MGSCAWLAMPRNTHRSDALTRQLEAVRWESGSAHPSLFRLLEELANRLQQIEQRLAELERAVVPQSIPLPASLFDEVFADEEEAEESP